MKEEKNDSRKVLLVFLFMLGLTVILFGATYAFFRYSKEGIKKSSIALGKVTLHYQEGNGAISLTDALPMDETRGKAQTNYFEFTITSDTADYEIPYIITARKQGTDATRVPSENIRIYLTQLVNNVEVEKLYTTYDQLTDILKNNHIEQQLYTENVPVNTSNYEKVYRLRMWIDEDTDYSPTEVNGVQVYPMQDKVFAVTINVYTEVEAAPQTCQLAFDVTGTLQNAGSLTIGDEVEIGTEHFYVVSSDSDTTVLLSKYNMTIHNYATPIGSVDDLQFDEGSDYSYNPRVQFSYEDYWKDTIDNNSVNPIVYDPTKVTEPTFDDHTCAPTNQYTEYFHDTLGIPYDNDNNHSYDLWSYDPNTYEQNSNLYLYYQSRYENFNGYECAFNNFKIPEGELPGYNGGRNGLKSVDENIDYSVAYYVNRYKNKLESLYSNISISNARLLTYDEAEQFVNNNISLFNHEDYYGFWLANINIRYDSHYNEYLYKVYYLNSSGIQHDVFESAVRPVLEVPTCSINLD